MKCSIMLHFIWVFTVCKSTRLRVSRIQWVNGGFGHTVKPVLNGHSKIDKTKVLKTDDHLMPAKSIAECSPLEHSAILLICIKQ